MRVIMVMFDTLTRKLLPNYGNDWVQAPNFQRLAEHCTRFDRFYGGSMPCMPARRELHTGKYNFLRRGWGPLEPFDRSVMEVLKQNGIYTHLVTDHSHYWEDGGATYHNRYNSWEGFRGQENDCFVPSDILPEMPAPYCALGKTGKSLQQHYRNRTRQATRETMPSVQTFQAGLDFLAEHAERDNWFLQIEAFDPHEPFYVPEEYRKRYGLPAEETLFWPKYGQLPAGDYKEALENGAKEYAALLSLCDENLGRVLDFMDAHEMWKDTALIVDGAGKKEDIENRIQIIRAELERVDSDFDREKAQERLAKLSGGVAVLKVGAATESELKEKKSRIEDALQATRAAVEEGIVAGGGVALVDAIGALDAVKADDKDEEVGIDIIRKAIEAPMRAIAQNAGFEGSVVVEKVKSLPKGEGLNCANGEYGNMIEMGVNDPVKVTRTALQSAASVAALILITEATINEIPKEGPDLSALAAGMQGGGGMY